MPQFGAGAAAGVDGIENAPQALKDALNMAQKAPVAQVN
jgi:hypothetical protein